MDLESHERLVDYASMPQGRPLLPAQGREQRTDPAEVCLRGTAGVHPAWV